ncbi:NADH-quinone oxidoreductase subunit A [Micromonospora siamensis]|nr:NADH-quinone oxidoreductase subunit A [Micromonospora siamensis]
MLGVAAALVGTLYLVQLGTAVARDATTVPAFRSGLPPREHAVSRFHARWYAVSLLFLAFDVEMLFMYPWAVVVAQVGTPAVVEMFVFLGLLMAGVLYAWREGALRWA